MGFYHPATLVKDAQHHGTDVLPVDVTRSGRLCGTDRLKGPRPKHLPRPGPAVVTPSLAGRLALRFVRGLRASTADTLEDDVASPLPEMSRFEETVSEYQTTELTAGPHLVAHFRAQLKKDGTLSIRAERFERMSLEEPIPELRKPVSPPNPRHRESTPPSHDSR